MSYDRGRGRMGGFGLGINGECVCNRCGHTEPHITGKPCMFKLCPNCKAMMTRKR